MKAKWMFLSWRPSNELFHYHIKYTLELLEFSNAYIVAMSGQTLGKLSGCQEQPLLNTCTCRLVNWYTSTIFHTKTEILGIQSVYISCCYVRQAFRWSRTTFGEYVITPVYNLQRYSIHKMNTRPSSSTMYTGTCGLQVAKISMHTCSSANSQWKALPRVNKCSQVFKYSPWSHLHCG